MAGTVDGLFNTYRDEHLDKGTCDPSRAVKAWKKLSPVFGALAPEGITVKAVNAYRVAREWDGVSLGTIDREIGVLVAALNHAKKTGVLSSVPYIPRMPSSARRERVLSSDEVRLLVDTAKAMDRNVHTFCVIALTTSQRYGAIMGLRWSQIDWVRGTINFNDHGLTLPERRKGRAHVPMTDDLKAHLLFRKLSAQSPYVMETGQGRQLYCLRHAWRDVIEATGLKDVTPHILRHTVATNLIGAEVSLERVSQLLGHKSVRTTQQVYVKTSPEFLSSTVAALTA